jgi:hypothetical protein
MGNFGTSVASLSNTHQSAMRYTILFLFTALLTLTSSAPAHKFHFSFTEVVHNTQNQSLEITIRIFTDDLENTLQSEREELLRLGDEREHEDADLLIESYLKNNFSLQINGTPLVLDFLGKEVDHDITFCYLELPQVPPTNAMTIQSTILFELFSDQLNRVKVEFNGWTRTEDLVAKLSVMKLYN